MKFTSIIFTARGSILEIFLKYRYFFQIEHLICRTPYFSSASTFEEYVKNVRSLSHYRCNVDVVPGDRLLTLATCTGTDDNKRLIVMARKLRDNENELELQMGILSTSDRNF